MRKTLPFYRQFTVLALFFLGGIFASSVIRINFIDNVLILVFLLLLCLGAGFINYILGNKWYALAAMSVAFCGLGVMLTSLHLYRTAYSWPEEPVTVIGVVTQPPIDKLDSQLAYLRVECRESEAGKCLSVVKRPLITANLPLLPEVHYGDRLRLQGAILPSLSLSDRKYPVTGTIGRPESVQLIGSALNTSTRPIALLYELNSYLEDILSGLLPEPHASLAAGILLGQKRSLPKDFQKELSTTGLTHVVALSGYNVTILIVIVVNTLVMRLGRRRAYFLGLLVILAFITMTGLSSSVVRAAIFSLLVLAGNLVGRKGDQTNLMLLAAVLMAISNPLLLYYDVGFQLSFLAFSGLIYISPRIERRLELGRWNLIPESVRGVLSETLGAQLAVLPLLLINFGQVSLISPLANILVLWILPAIMLFATLTVLSAPLSVAVAKLGALLVWPLLEYMIRIVGALSRLPLAAISLSGTGLWWALVFWLVAIALLFVPVTKIKSTLG